MKKSKKSFVTYRLEGGKAYLGMNLIVGTTVNDQQRICENCIHRCLIGSPGDSKLGKANNMTDCSQLLAKKAFNATEKVIMPKKLAGQHVGNFCKFFEFANQSSNTGNPDFSEDVSTSEKTAYVFIKDENEEVLFVAPAKGKYYYPSGYVLPVNTNKNNLRKFFSVEEAMNAGYVSRF